MLGMAQASINCYLVVGGFLRQLDWQAMEAFALLAGVRKIRWLPQCLRFFSSPGAGCTNRYRKVVSRIKTPEGFEAEEVQGSVKYFGSYIVVCAYELMFFLGILQQNMGHMGRKVMFWLSKCWSAGYCWATFASFRSWSHDSP